MQLPGRRFEPDRNTHSKWYRFLVMIVVKGEEDSKAATLVSVMTVFTLARLACTHRNFCSFFFLPVRDERRSSTLCPLRAPAHIYLP